MIGPTGMATSPKTPHGRAMLTLSTVNLFLYRVPGPYPVVISNYCYQGYQGYQ
jgi:hypothetical protein